MSRSGPPDTTRPTHRHLEPDAGSDHLAPGARPDPTAPGPVETDRSITFVPGDPPRASTLLLGTGPAALREALPALHVRDDRWGLMTALALEVVARGAITPTVSPPGA